MPCEKGRRSFQQGQALGLGVSASGDFIRPSGFRCQTATASFQPTDFPSHLPSETGTASPFSVCRRGPSSLTNTRIRVFHSDC